jgi:hypothetical protein
LQIGQKKFSLKAEIGFMGGDANFPQTSPTQEISDQDQTCSSRTKIEKSVSSGSESCLDCCRNSRHTFSFQDWCHWPSIFAFHKSRWPNNNNLLEVEKKFDEHQKGLNNKNSSIQSELRTQGDLKWDLLRDISHELTLYNSEEQANLIARKCRTLNLALQVQQTRWQRLKEVSAVQGLISESNAILKKLRNIKAQINAEKSQYSISSKRRPDGEADSLPEEEDVQLAASFDLLVREIKNTVSR